MSNVNLTTTLYRMGTVKKDYVYYVKQELDANTQDICNDVSNAIKEKMLNKRAEDVYSNYRPMQPEKGTLVVDYLLNKIDFELKRIADFETYAFILHKHEFVIGMISGYRSKLLEARAQLVVEEIPEQAQKLKALDELICSQSDEWLSEHCRR